MKQANLFGSRYILFEDGTIQSGTTGGFLSLKPDSSGYPACNLWDGSRYHKCRVHSLMAKHFLPNPTNKRTVNHIDGNKTNNHLSNLEWATDAENLQHAHDNIPRKSTRKLSFGDIEDILFSTEEATNLAHKYSTSSQHIRSIRRGKYIKEYIKAGNPLPVDLKDHLCL